MSRTFAPGNRMKKSYGESPAQYCDYCCNCQLACKTGKTKICIAYDRSTVWDLNQRACGLFNVAFEGIKPSLRPLAEMYGSKSSHEESRYEQASFLSADRND